MKPKAPRKAARRTRPAVKRNAKAAKPRRVKLDDPEPCPACGVTSGTRNLVTDMDTLARVELMRSRRLLDAYRDYIIDQRPPGLHSGLAGDPTAGAVDQFILDWHEDFKKRPEPCPCCGEPDCDAFHAWRR